MAKLAQHTPTSAQLTQLQTLQAAVTSTAATEAAAFVTYTNAKTAAKQAAKDFANYNHFAVGATSKPGVISGNPDET